MSKADAFGIPIHIWNATQLTNETIWLQVNFRAGLIPTSRCDCAAINNPDDFQRLNCEGCGVLYLWRVLMKHFLFTLYESQRPVSWCWINIVVSPYLMRGTPRTSSSFSSIWTFLSSFSFRSQKAVAESVAFSGGTRYTSLSSLKARYWPVISKHEYLYIRKGDTLNIAEASYLSEVYVSYVSMENWAKCICHTGQAFYKPVVMWCILKGFSQLTKAPAHFVRTSSSLHSERAWFNTAPPS